MNRESEIRNQRSSFTYDEEVSEVMEENIRESDFDVNDKNQKLSIIQTSNQMTFRHTD